MELVLLYIVRKDICEGIIIEIYSVIIGIY